VESVDRGGVPALVTQQMRDVASRFYVEIRGADSPRDVVEKIRRAAGLPEARQAPPSPPDAPEDLAPTTPVHEGPATAPSNGKAKRCPEPPPEREDVRQTDVGNARRLVELHGKDLRYVHVWKTWLLWDGTRWRPDDSGEAMRRAKETIDALFCDTAAEIERIGKEMQCAADEGAKGALQTRLAQAKKLQAWALRSEQVQRLEAMLKVAQSDLPISPNKLDADKFLLNVQNGTLNLRTGELQPHRREDFLTKLAPVSYDPEACCPEWEKALARWMDDNKDLVTYLQRVIGYSLTGDVSEQSLWFFYGTGANGKSTFLGTVQAMLGDYAMQAVSELLMVKAHESHPAERADLFGKRFVATIETEDGKRLAEALVKQMTGGDRMRARALYQNFFEFTPTHKIFLGVNHKPVIGGTDHGIWRRIKLVPFMVTISDEEKDKALPEKLKAELAGILAWAVRGCLDWRREGLAEPDEVRQATTEYQAEQDSVAAFLAHCCAINPEYRVQSSALFKAYQDYSGDRIMTQKAFTKRMESKEYPSQRGTGGRMFYFGVGLPAEDHEWDSGG
jgi:putative DNA primase/helicase